MKRTIKLLAIILAVIMLMPFTVVNATSTKLEEVLDNLNSTEIFKFINATAKYENDTIEIEYSNYYSPISFEIEGNVIKYESGNIEDFTYEEARSVVNRSDYFKEFIVNTALRLNGYSDEDIGKFFEDENEFNYDLNGIEILEVGGDYTFTSDNENEGSITTSAKLMRIDLEKANLKTSESDETEVPGTTVEALVEAIKENEIFKISNRIKFDNYSIDITYTDKTVFTCKDGVLTYESGDVTNYDEAADVIIHRIWISVLLQYALESNGYTTDQIGDFEETEDYDFDLNGIEILNIGGEKTFTKGTETINTSAVSVKIDFEKANLKKLDSNIEYEVLEGANQTFKIGEDKKLTFRFDIDYDTFKTYGDVWVDDTRVEEDNFTSESGSTIITFNDEYTNELSEGEHHIEVALAQGRLGVAKTDFTIEKASTSSNPKTGDNIAVWISLIVISMLGIAGTVKFVKK